MPPMAQFLDEKLPARFWDKAIPCPMSGCWLWSGCGLPNGYGLFGRAKGSRLAHRVAYEALVGKIADGLQIDHLCRVRCCVNPAHMEEVTQRENILRGVSPSRVAARHAAVTHCPRGHAYAPSNTGLERRSNRWGTVWVTRYCRACRNEKRRERRRHG